MISVPFRSVPVGSEFYWGAYKIENMNWARKRSTRTADYRPNLNGVMSEHSNWGYWGQNELVYVTR